MPKEKSDIGVRAQRVYGKYSVTNITTGAINKGRFFVLKIDAKTAGERRAVQAALKRYAIEQRKSGRWDYAHNVEEYAGLTGNVLADWCQLDKESEMIRKLLVEADALLKGAAGINATSGKMTPNDMIRCAKLVRRIQAHLKKAEKVTA